MKLFSRYTGGSIILHLLLIIVLVDLDFSGKRSSPYDIYYVDLVSAMPYSSDERSVVAKPGVKIASEVTGETISSLPGIEKENFLPNPQQEYAPLNRNTLSTDIEENEARPPEGELSDYTAHNPAPPIMGQGFPKNNQGDSFHMVSLWKLQVKRTVDTAWKTPFDTLISNMPLKTTFLLKISRKGDLLDKKLLVSSGNRVFDRSIQITLDNVKRLPDPPLAMIAGQGSVEITMTFTPPKAIN